MAKPLTAAQKKAQSLEAAIAAAKAAQPAAPTPSRWQIRALLNPKTSDGERRKAFYQFHPGTQFPSRMDVAGWLGELEQRLAA